MLIAQSWRIFCRKEITARLSGKCENFLPGLKTFGQALPAMPACLSYGIFIGFTFSLITRSVAKFPTGQFLSLCYEQGLTSQILPWYVKISNVTLYAVISRRMLFLLSYHLATRRQEHIPRYPNLKPNHCTGRL